MIWSFVNIWFKLSFCLSGAVKAVSQKTVTLVLLGTNYRKPQHLSESEWPHASMQVPDPQRDTTGCKPKKPNEASSKKALGCDLMSHAFDIQQDWSLLNSLAVIVVRLMSDIRLLPVIPGQNGSTNLETFGSSPVPLFKRLKSQAFMELPIQTPFCATFVNS